jgi:hypothetical protein
VVDDFLVLFGGSVVGPVKVKAVPGIVIHISILLRAGEGLVWVEAFEVEVPVFSIVVVVEEFNGSDEALGGGVVFIAFGIHKFAVDPIGSSAFSQALSLAWSHRKLVPGFDFTHLLLFHSRIIDQRMPYVAFLAAEKFPGVETGVVTFSPTVVVMKMIGDQVRVGALLTAEFRLETVIPGLNGTPRSFEKVQVARV